MEYRGRMYPGPLGDAREHEIRVDSPNKSDTDITIQHAVTPTGPVGQQIKLRDLDTERPTAWSSTFGGFVGRVEMGPFRCVKVTSACGRALTAATPKS